MTTLAHTQTAGVNAKRVTIGSVCRLLAGGGMTDVWADLEFCARKLG